MTNTMITAAPLAPFLQGLGISEEQKEALELELFLDAGNCGAMAQGSMLLFPVQAILEALWVIDDHPWKDTNAREFREYVQREVNATGIRYWITGLKSLAPEKELDK